MRGTLVAMLILASPGCRFHFDHLGAGADAATGDAIDGAASGLRMETWGENSNADHRMVTRDTWLSAQSGELAWNYGTANPLELNDGERVPLLAFDLAAIPPDATVTSSKLRLQILPCLHAPIEVHRVLEPWSEGTQNGSTGEPSWTSRAPLTAWSGAGAMPPSSQSSAIGNSAADAFGTVDVVLAVPTVQSWVADPAQNHGVALFVVNSDPCDIASREANDGARPTLIVQYMP